MPLVLMNTRFALASLSLALIASCHGASAGTGADRSPGAGPTPGGAAGSAADTGGRPNVGAGAAGNDSGGSAGVAGSGGVADGGAGSGGAGSGGVVGFGSGGADPGEVDIREPLSGTTDLGANQEVVLGVRNIPEARMDALVADVQTHLTIHPSGGAAVAFQASWTTSDSPGWAYRIDVKPSASLAADTWFHVQLDAPEAGTVVGGSSLGVMKNAVTTAVDFRTGSSPRFRDIYEFGPKGGSTGTGVALSEPVSGADLVASLTVEVDGTAVAACPMFGGVGCATVGSAGTVSGFDLELPADASGKALHLTATAGGVHLEAVVGADDWMPCDLGDASVCWRAPAPE